MISLNVYLDAKAGKSDQLEVAIRDGWMAEMICQPGFMSAALLKSLPDDQLDVLQAIKPKGEFELVAFWCSEEERAAWVARPIHDEVFGPVIELSENVSYTVQSCQHSWDLS